MAEPRYLKLSEVPAYIEATHGVVVTRQTVYNWAKLGIRGTKLTTETVAHTLRTTEAWIDAFLATHIR